MFISPLINRHLFITQRMTNQISLATPTCFGVYWHSPHCKFFAAHHIICKSAHLS